jgi:hypothetical protein
MALSVGALRCYLLDVIFGLAKQDGDIALLELGRYQRKTK